ncbi:MAG: phospholipase D family protein [Rhodoferax sp.]
MNSPFGRSSGMLIATLLAVMSLLTACASLPALEGRSVSVALADSSQTWLGLALAQGVAAHPGKTGIHTLVNPHDAFAARAVLAAAAEKSLDVQYYIWHADQVGLLLFEALWQAAERGVRVRLLLDDMNTSGLDPMIATLTAHPNMEVRLYNPIASRSSRALNFLTDFTRLNHRMHNKSFTADNQVSVVGGRNIGNEYFGVGKGVVFADLDVVAVGAAVRDVSSEFDLYWNSPSAYPAASLVGLPAADGVASLKSRFSQTRADPDSVDYIDATLTTPLDTTARTDVLLFPALMHTMGRAEKTFELISPYFVPGDEGTLALVGLARSGVKVRILTNSLAASDESAVHAGYAKHRHDLLTVGVQLYEMKPNAVAQAREKFRLGRSSSTGLHAKTFAVDRSRIFVGSFNMDQRSAKINTEMGLVIDSPALAQQLAAFFEDDVPMIAYEARLVPEGSKLEWTERTAAGAVRHGTEPEASWLLRAKVNLLSVLPIDWLL